MWNHDQGCPCSSCVCDRTYKPKKDECAFVCTDGSVIFRQQPPALPEVWTWPGTPDQHNGSRRSTPLRRFRRMFIDWPHCGWVARTAYIEETVLEALCGQEVRKTTRQP